MNAGRGFTAMPHDRALPEMSARRSASILRAVYSAGAMLRHAAVGLAAIRVHCLLYGHDDVFAREPNRLFLRCRECDRATRGWAIATSVLRVAAQLPGQNARTRTVQIDRSRRSSSTLRLLRNEPDGSGRIS